MSDFSGEHGFVPEWGPPALVVVFIVQGALVGFLGGSWVTLAVVLGVEAASAGLGLVCWLVYPRVQGWRTDRVLRREDDEFAWVSATPWSQTWTLMMSGIAARRQLRSPNFRGVSIRSPTGTSTTVTATARFAGTDSATTSISRAMTT